MTTNEDDELIERARSGDLSAAYTAWRTRLKRNARSRGRKHSASDAVHEAFLAALKVGKVDDLLVFLATVTKRRAIDQGRKNTKNVQMDNEPTSEPPATDVLLLESLLQMSETLTDAERNVLRHLSAGDSYSRVAATLGKSEANCRQHASRAMSKLRKEFPNGG